MDAFGLRRRTSGENQGWIIGFRNIGYAGAHQEVDEATRTDP